MLEFNPNQKPKKIEYATYVPGRRTSPKFKMHRQRNHALAAMVDPSILYRYIDGEWVEIFRIENYVEPDECQECGRDLIIRRENWNYNAGRRKWKDTNTNSPYILWVCKYCKGEK